MGLPSRIQQMHSHSFIFLMQKRRIKRLHGSPYVISLEPTDLLGQGSFGRVVRAFNLEDSSEDLVAKIMEITNSSSLRTLKQEFNILEAF
jgi:serine/threonine-protein kinase ULK/ATG1